MRPKPGLAQIFEPDMSIEQNEFDIPVDRTEVPTLKFDGDTMQSLFGSADLWPS